MCGIFGLVVASPTAIERSAWERAVRDLFLLSQSRGKEAAGIAIANADEIVVHKDSVAAEAMVATPEYARVVERAAAGFFCGGQDRGLATIGHARLVTNGLQGIDANNQPVWRDDVVIVHNGIVTNWQALWQANPDIAPRAEVDTEVIAALLHKYRSAGATAETALSRVFTEVIGETSVAVLTAGSDDLLLATNTGSLHYCVSTAGDAIFFASEKHICEKLTEGSQAIQGFSGVQSRQLHARMGMTLNLGTCRITEYSLRGARLAAPDLAPALGVQRRIEEKCYSLESARRSLRRCSRCLLPETMPFITYDASGVCSYCQTYEPWKKGPEEELEEQLARHRGDGKSADCVVAFSGGRDSSYGLHLLREKYGMTPITFSYDWGMVTDLGRRNQARMCGQLGLEHIWISADIKAKRANIRRNVEAWLRKPDLGIIPLFMAGDKQFFWYANALIKQTRLPLMVFCTNRLEKTDFKLGFLGIPPQTSGFNKPSSFAMSQKTRMLWEYGRRYFGNPRYLNRSLPDTVWAFVSYYGINQDHLYLYDYADWREEVIDDVLINVYDWECADDTPCTWRIGDGTAAFYNHIYMTVAGFSEHDTFRSNQVREGQIDRQTALDLVERDNQPRWKSIREYTQLINIDFDEAIRVIDRIPKLYAGD